jgi:hypothetical protein
MQRIGTNVRGYLQKIRTPEFIAGTASAILTVFLWEAASQAVQSSLNRQNVGFYLMTVIALICLILVTFSLMRIEKLVENRNYTRFITSKPERLNLMTECIKNAKQCIYILSDLSGTEETQLEEHVKYIDALNQVLDDKKGNTDFEVKRIVVPTYASGKDTEADPDWIYTAPITQAYREHFRRLYEFDETSLKHTNGPCNVSVILIDNKYLFWRPELTFGDKALDTLLDGGLYLENYTPEGIADVAKSFLIMHGRARWTNPDQFDSTKPKIE